MKSLKTILGISLAAVGLSGSIAFGAAASLSSKQVEKAEAGTQTITDSSIEIRFTRNGDWGNNNPHIHTWNEGGSGTTWPGYEMKWLWNNEYGQGVFSWSPSSDEPLYGNIIFNNNNSGMQSDTLSAPSTSKWFYYDNGWQNSDVPTMDIYLYDYDNKYNGSVNVYAYRDNGSGGAAFKDAEWPGNSATRLTSIASNGLIYKMTLNNRYDRVIFSSSGNNQTSDLTPTGSYCYVRADAETVLDGKNTWWDNINYVYAHNFSQNTMLMRSIPTSDQSSTQYCASRYSYAKTAISAFKTSDYWQYVQPQLSDNFAAALTRLSAWATANHESFNSSTGVFSSRMADPLNSENSGTISIVLVAVSAITVSSFGLYFFLKKKKKHN